MPLFLKVLFCWLKSDGYKFKVNVLDKLLKYSIRRESNKR